MRLMVTNMTGCFLSSAGRLCYNPTCKRHKAYGRRRLMKFITIKRYDMQNYKYIYAEDLVINTEHLTSITKRKDDTGFYELHLNSYPSCIIDGDDAKKIFSIIGANL